MRPDAFTRLGALRTFLPQSVGYNLAMRTVTTHSDWLQARSEHYGVAVSQRRARASGLDCLQVLMDFELNAPFPIIRSVSAPLAWGRNFPTLIKFDPLGDVDEWEHGDRARYRESINMGDEQIEAIHETSSFVSDSTTCISYRLAADDTSMMRSNEGFVLTLENEGRTRVVMLKLLRLGDYLVPPGWIATYFANGMIQNLTVMAPGMVESVAAFEMALIDGSTPPSPVEFRSRTGEVMWPASDPASSLRSSPVHLLHESGISPFGSGPIELVGSWPGEPIRVESADHAGELVPYIPRQSDQSAADTFLVRLLDDPARGAALVYYDDTVPTHST